jgi:hypothetical protein
VAGQAAIDQRRQAGEAYACEFAKTGRRPDNRPLPHRSGGGSFDPAFGSSNVHAGRERAPFLTWEFWRRHRVCLTPERTPDHGATGGQQRILKNRLLCRRSPGGKMDRRTDPRSMVRWGVSDCRVAPVARAVGSLLGGNRLAGSGLVTIALSIRRPKRAHTQAARVSSRWRSDMLRNVTR